MTHWIAKGKIQKNTFSPFSLQRALRSQQKNRWQHLILLLTNILRSFVQLFANSTQKVMMKEKKWNFKFQFISPQFASNKGKRCKLEGIALKALKIYYFQKNNFILKVAKK